MPILSRLDSVSLSGSNDGPFAVLMATTSSIDGFFAGGLVLGDDLALRFDGAFLVALVALRFAWLTIFVEDEIDASGAVGSDTFASCNILAADLTLPAVFWDIRVHLASSSCRYGIAIEYTCSDSFALSTIFLATAFALPYLTLSFLGGRAVVVLTAESDVVTFSSDSADKGDAAADAIDGTAASMPGVLN